MDPNGLAPQANCPAFKAIVRSKDPGCDMFDEIVVNEPNEPNEP
jgi:hypothetical protein